MKRSRQRLPLAPSPRGLPSNPAPPPKPAPDGRTSRRPSAAPGATGVAHALPLKPSSSSSSSCRSRRQPRSLLLAGLYVATAALVGTTMLAATGMLPGLVPPLPSAALGGPAAAASAAAAEKVPFAPKALRQQSERGGGRGRGAPTEPDAAAPPPAGRLVSSSSSSSSSSSPPSSPLELLYGATGGGRRLKEWAREHALRTYPSLFGSPENEVLMGNPSLAHDPATNRTVVGFRVQVRASKKRVRMARYLMFCETAATGRERGTGPIATKGYLSTSWRCQDSGWDTSYVPPECDPAYWGRPHVILPYGPLTRGPEDARMFFDADGNLGATAMMRGCHPFTPYGNRTALWSVYTARWTRSPSDGGAWRMDRPPKVLDLRTPAMAHLGDAYPFATKSWVAIPSAKRTTGTATSRAAPPPTDEGLLLSVGWTPGMKDHVVYRVAQTLDTLSAVVPANSRASHAQADVRTYRASTNLVEFRGAWLGMGHRQVHAGGTKTYYHYWYAFCGEAPYRAIAQSDLFLLPDDPAVGTSFALGLALEGLGPSQNVYLAWSENDTTPYLTRYSSDDVFRALQNSSDARERGHPSRDGQGDDNFAAPCAVVDGSPIVTEA